MPLDEVPAESQANVEACVRRAVELGINHFETARGYGSSERQLGGVLPKLPRDQIIVQTKFAPAANVDDFVANVRDSIRRLQVDYLDLLTLHGINNAEVGEWTMRPNGCLAAARQLQREGLIRHVGFSTHGPLDVIQQTARHEGDGGFDYINCHWYFVFQHNWPSIEEAAKRDMGVFIISPSDKGGKLYEPSGRFVELCQPLHPIVFNDLFGLTRPAPERALAHTLRVGAARPSDFDLHVEAAGLLDRADELLGPIIERLDRVMRQAVDEDLLDPFRLPVPDWEHTPGHINIPIALWLRNLAIAYDMVEFGKMRYNLLGGGGHWFPGQQASKLGDEVTDAQIRAAIDDPDLAQRMPDLLRQTH
ncbi:MAG: aldo/keto reductase, partial [Phycisphaeraceae bacterium]|nr:aldo/keto reductase [Phycisphaeraceae bacterium]